MFCITLLLSFAKHRVAQRLMKKIMFDVSLRAKIRKVVKEPET